MILEEKSYIDKAESVIKKLTENKDKWGKPVMVTTSKIRNLLAMTADIYNEVLGKEETLSDDVNARIDYLRIRVLYECGRDNERQQPVKTFIEKAGILEALKEINGSRKRYIIFSHYMEALVAFHKYYGGQD